MPAPSASRTAARARAARAAEAGCGIDAAGLSDGELVAGARRGDAEAREELARRCRRPAYLLALQLLRDPDDALDVAQDALLRLFTHLDRFQPGRAVQPWLCAIVRNRARDLLRGRRRRRWEPLEGEEGEPRREIVDAAPGPEAGAAERELQARIWRTLAALPEGQREILVLRDYQDLSYEEIAGVLEVPLGTVMSRLHRARRALGALLAAGRPGSPPLREAGDG
jgi:RNA polymerase sigma-70 factor (ECF subfamily)